ncbi:hypothetical protein [Leptospira vanthielii]|uniref:Uncharacterized protein n=1 Tax=Leptospira vanthielii serovar Holland str. Waz Holland = ATCC 700522 TaxID=1218591 RepID=N1W3I9_9LEPT|nr:hypothetical protein [Leptospira vanthielii]EMY67797.1 hypothetical protein LEP1GSC199_0111 [Leptospira vanthielii serovar Holland str. Waz Holland = ATCC 700522]
MEEYKPKSKEIWELFKKQKFRCCISNRRFTKLNVDLGLKIPLEKGGKPEFDNLCLFDKAFSGLKKYYTIEEIREIFSEVVNHEQG